MNNFIGLKLEDAQSSLSSEVRLTESAPPVRPVSNRPPRKKSQTKTQEVKVPRVQNWGEIRVLRSREIVENEVGNVVLEMTIAREEAVSSSFAAALSS